MQKLELQVSDDQYNALLEQAKKEVRRELTDKALKEYLAKNAKAISLKQYLREFELYDKAETIMDENKAIKDLNTNEKFILALTWLGYDQMMR